MSSPISPVIADFVLLYLEDKALGRLLFNMPFYFRFVDDILMTVPISFINKVMDIFNFTIGYNLLINSAKEKALTF